MEHAVAVIGRVTEGQGVTVIDGEGREITPGNAGWSHFRS
jgi:thiamine monophosphate kinase